MASQKFQLAQFNIGTMRYPRHSEQMADYREQLNQLTPIALAWPGFIWIMDDTIINLAQKHYGQGVAANLSVWADVESLTNFMNCPPHAAAMGRGDDWFVFMAQASYVFWWVPLNTQPAFNDACERLEALRRDGPSANAFTLEHSFPAPGASA